MAQTKPKKGGISGLLRNGDVLLVAAVFTTILLMILPIHPFLLDGFLAVSIALSLLILLAILYVKEPAEFTGFPTLLLFVTLFRLSLNIASSRLILLDGYAGHIIETFGNYVVHGNYVVGMVIFLILVLINFIVITKGAGRIAEVAARFTLDAMPGKQMAIDAELNAGIINEVEARTRRRKVEQEADFYGAMDGASKFVRGDAIAAILITLINVLGGFAIGIMQKGMTVSEALQRFTLLSIGDGLVSQIPALITSTAAGTAPDGTPNAKGAAPNAAGDKLETLLNLDALQIELGFKLVSLADARKGGDMLDRVTGVRKAFDQEMGVIVPPIRLRDNLQLEPIQYRFLLKGNPIAQGELMPDHWLAMNACNSKVVLKGVPTVEPVFKLPATWVTDVERKNAEISGYTVVDASSVLVTHLSETVKRNCHNILTRQDVQNLLDNLKQTHPTVVTELIPAQLNVGQVQRILQNLLAEGISIRNLAGILEKVSDYAAVTKNPDELSEHARRALGSQIVKPYQGDNGSLQAITLDPRLEQQIAQGVKQTPTEITLMMEPKLARHVVDTLSQKIQQLLSDGQPALIMCAPQIRLAFRRFFETTFADLTVLSYAEVPSRVQIMNAGIVASME